MKDVRVLAPLPDGEAGSRENASRRCPICLDPVEDEAYTDTCKHRFCFTCILQWAEFQQSQAPQHSASQGADGQKAGVACPLCKTPFTILVHDFENGDPQRFYVTPEDARHPQFQLSAAHRQRRAVYFGRNGGASSLARKRAARDASSLGEAYLWQLLPWVTRELQALMQEEDVDLVARHVAGTVAAFSGQKRQRRERSSLTTSTQAPDWLSAVASAVQPFVFEHADEFAEELRSFLALGGRMDDGRRPDPTGGGAPSGDQPAAASWQEGGDRSSTPPPPTAPAGGASQGQRGIGPRSRPGSSQRVASEDLWGQDSWHGVGAGCGAAAAHRPIAATGQGAPASGIAPAGHVTQQAHHRHLSLPKPRYPFPDPLATEPGRAQVRERPGSASESQGLGLRSRSGWEGKPGQERRERIRRKNRRGSQGAHEDEGEDGEEVEGRKIGRERGEGRGAEEAKEGPVEGAWSGHWKPSSGTTKRSNGQLTRVIASERPHRAAQEWGGVSGRLHGTLGRRDRGLANVGFRSTYLGSSDTASPSSEVPLPSLRATGSLSEPRPNLRLGREEVEPGRPKLGCGGREAPKVMAEGELEQELEELRLRELALSKLLSRLGSQDASSGHGYRASGSARGTGDGAGEDVGTERPFSLARTDDPGTAGPGAAGPGTDEPGTDEPGTDEPGAAGPGKSEPRRVSSIDGEPCPDFLGEVPSAAAPVAALPIAGVSRSAQTSSAEYPLSSGPSAPCSSKHGEAEERKHFSGFPDSSVNAPSLGSGPETDFEVKVGSAKSVGVGEDGSLKGGPLHLEKARVCEFTEPDDVDELLEVSREDKIVFVEHHINELDPPASVRNVQNGNVDGSHRSQIDGTLQSLRLREDVSPARHSLKTADRCEKHDCMRTNHRQRQRRRWGTLHVERSIRDVGGLKMAPYDCSGSQVGDRRRVDDVEGKVESHEKDGEQKVGDVGARRSRRIKRWWLEVGG